ncbi:MAG: hypothetical protein J3K34DRAFT_142794 [Monoraphidium minutum]|nr:MAG: hypothetical protein J3K34DRAFT_142794 [Monoraphidium minutum]
MELSITCVALKKLTALAKADEAAPPSLDFKVPLPLPQGFARIRFLKQSPVGAGGEDDDPWIGMYLHWDDKLAKVPRAACYVMVLCSVDGGGRRSLLGGEGYTFDDAFRSFSKQLGYDSEKTAQWSVLRRAVGAGGSLEVVVATLPSSEPADADAALRVPPPGASFPAQQLLGGPFSDVVLVSGGRRFSAHRVVLAAASPVFLSMLDTDMVEGGAAEVELKETDPAVAELLLQHVYGAAVEVPLAAAPALYGLADRFQVGSGLAEQLLLWLCTAPLQPAAMVELLPQVATLCPEACCIMMYMAAGDALDELQLISGFGAWPVEGLVEVIKHASPFNGFAAAATWMAAQPPSARQRHRRPARQRSRWPQLLDAVPWDSTTCDDLDKIGLLHHFPAGAPRFWSHPGSWERLVFGMLGSAGLRGGSGCAAQST